jgi:hypothetical protein
MDLVLCRIPTVLRFTQIKLHLAVCSVQNATAFTEPNAPLSPSAGLFFFFQSRFQPAEYSDDAYNDECLPSLEMPLSTV